LPGIQLSDPPVQGRAGHSQVTGHMGGRLPGVDEATGVADLAVAELLTPSA
jgi:hypothetical protein